MPISCRIACLFTALVHVCFEPAVAQGEYQTPAAFVTEVFGTAAPAPRRLWLTPDLKTRIRQDLNIDLKVLRLPYWRTGNQSVWILEDVGKERPITMGFVITDGVLSTTRVLVFRESRGWEIRYPFFTDQFAGVRLNEEGELDRDINGISGATLSVNTAQRLARLALLLDRQSVTGQVATGAQAR